MKSLNKIGILADIFERKLRKNAEEVGDSSQLTLAFRPKLNDLLTESTPALKSIITKLMQANAEGGDIVIGDMFTTSAKKLGNGTWVVDPSSSGVSVKGELASNPKVQLFIKNFNAKANKLVAAELNRLKNNFSAEENTITGHQTTMSNVNFGF